ncbi:MAG TPA: DNA/RNA non-specific endonuclease [Allosphingosinicella sp.]|nr:DNA/RNA non-specific endonuclease [Allosphingosinicella sp.]
MARRKTGKKSSRKADAAQTALIEALRTHVRSRGNDYLKDPNITSIGVGLKNGTGPISLQFTVGEKGESALESLATVEIPATITLSDGTIVPTDVIERNYKPAFELVEPESLNDRRVRRDPIQPGISISHPDGTAGTIGLIVFDRATGAPCVLSNWHVLHGNTGAIGDTIVQPGPFDDNNIAGNFSGKLLRSHLGNAGDCALARIERRGIKREIFELGVTPSQMAEVALGDKVMKSGRTTGITFGVVRRTDVIAKINYRLPAGEQAIGGFEIGVDPAHKPADGEVSKGGDSGCAWLIANGTKATDIFAGLHFAGETDGSADEHALACYPLSVQKKLDFVLDPPAAVVAPEGSAVTRSGYDPAFLSQPVPLPKLGAAAEGDAFTFEGRKLIPYTHFSVCLSKSRRMARYVAWNIDGARVVRTGRDDFQLDPRIPASRQLGEDLYAGNKLDRGHIARRADLVWGSIEEARQANSDSSFFTNIAPQHERFNQSGRKGLWGQLENLILEQVDVEDVRMSVFGGPLFADDDIAFRGVRIPREFWKLVAYVGEDAALKTAAFVLSQASLLSDLEAIDLDPFKLFQVRIADLEARAGLSFGRLDEADALARPEAAVVPRDVEALLVPADRAREISTVGDLRL